MKFYRVTRLKLLGNDRILALTIVLSFIVVIGEAFSHTQVTDQKKGDKSQAYSSFHMGE